MTTEERAEVLGWLDQSAKEFLSAIGGVSEGQWHWKPAPERWSVGETAEHVVLAEALLFRTVLKAVAAPPNPSWEEQTRGKTEFVREVMPSRQGRAVAPDSLAPSRQLTRVQVAEGFQNQRIEILRFAQETREPLKEHTIVHPFPVFGTLNAYQWLLYVPLHTIRHGRQIEEIKAAPGYPWTGSSFARQTD